MKNHHHHQRNRSTPSPFDHYSKSPPWIVRSNSAYENNDNISSVASNSSLLSERFQMKVGEEERRLREELGREIEKELERELMDGITVLVRKLSDLRARQIVRTVRESDRQHPWDELIVKNIGNRKNDTRERRSGVKASAIDRRKVIANDRRGDCREIYSSCSDAESRASDRKSWRKKF